MNRITILFIVIILLSGCGNKVSQQTEKNTTYESIKYTLSKNKNKSNIQDLNVSVKKIYKGTVVLNVKNNTKYVRYEYPRYQLYVYKNKKWKAVDMGSPLTVTLRPENERTLYICWETMGVNDEYLDEKKGLQKGRYKLLAFDVIIEFEVV